MDIHNYFLYNIFFRLKIYNVQCYPRIYVDIKFKFVTEVSMEAPQ